MNFDKILKKIQEQTTSYLPKSNTSLMRLNIYVI